MTLETCQSQIEVFCWSRGVFYYPEHFCAYFAGRSLLFDALTFFDGIFFHTAQGNGMCNLVFMLYLNLLLGTLTVKIF